MSIFRWLSASFGRIFRALFGGRDRRALGPDTVEEFRRDPAAVARFHDDNGKVGAYAMAAFVAQASLYLDEPFAKLEGLLFRESRLELAGGSSTLMHQGFNAVFAKDATGSTYAGFGTVTFTNQARERAVIILESVTTRGVSQGFAYAQLEPGDSYTFRHNVHPILLKIWVVVKGVAAAAATPAVTVPVLIALAPDTVMAVGGEVVAAFSGCMLVKQAALADHCEGPCTTGGPCHYLTLRPYGPWGWQQAASCGC